MFQKNLTSSIYRNLITTTSIFFLIISASSADAQSLFSKKKDKKESSGIFHKLTTSFFRTSAQPDVTSSSVSESPTTTSSFPEADTQPESIQETDSFFVSEAITTEPQRTSTPVNNKFNFGVVSSDAPTNEPVSVQSADLDQNGCVGTSDQNMLLSSWGACTDCNADINGDGRVDGADLGVLLGAWSCIDICGDGTVQNPNDEGMAEECDDGNTIDGDGCSKMCLIEETPDIENPFVDDYDMDITANHFIDQSSITNVVWDGLSNYLPIPDFSAQGINTNDPNLISLWRMNEASSSSEFMDMIGGHTASCSGNSCPIAGVSGQDNKAVDFDGSNDVLQIGSMDINGNQLTLSAWIKPEGGASDGRVISKATGSSDNAHLWMLSRINNNKLRFRLKTGSTTTTLIANTGNLQNGQWSHVAAVYNGSHMILYENGVEVGRTAKTGNVAVDSSVPVAIGSNAQGYGFFGGLIDDLAIFNKALSANEVQTLAQQANPINGTFTSKTIETNEVFYNLTKNGFNTPDGVTVEVSTDDTTWCTLDDDGNLSRTSCYPHDGASSFKYKVSFSQQASLNGIQLQWDTNPPPPEPQCSDGIDNDNDGAIDNDDFSCQQGGSDEDTFLAQCQDDVDNDEDGFIDDNDPDCSNHQDNFEETSSSDKSLVPGNGWSSPTPQPSDTGPALNTIARWDVVPLQTFDNKFEIGVIAFHRSGIDRVEFSVDNGPWTAITEMTLNPRTNVWEYWTTLDASLFSSDKKVEVRAIAYPKSGTPRVLQGDFDPHIENSRIRGEHSLFLYANANGAYDPVIRWASNSGSDNNGCGTSQGNACQTILKASQEIAAQKGNLEGGVVYLAEGTYHWKTSSGSSNQRWFTISGAPGTNKENVRIISESQTATTRFNKFKHLTIDKVVLSGGSSVTNRTAAWVDDAIVQGPGIQTISFLISGSTWEGGVYFTESIIRNMSEALRDTDFVRNSSVYNLSGDAFKEHSGLAVNIKVWDLLDVDGTHNDFMQWYTSTGEPGKFNHDDFENIIIYNVQCIKSCGGQGLHISTGPGQGIHKDWAIVNYATASEGGGGVNFLDEMDNILLWHFGHYRPLPENPYDYLRTGIGRHNDPPLNAITNLDIRNSFFHALGLHFLGEDNSKFEGWAQDIHTIHRAHYGPGVIPVSYDSSTTYSTGSYTSGVSQDTALCNPVFIDHVNADYRPSSNSVLIGSNRANPVELIVPVDVNNNPRPSDGSASIGPFEPPVNLSSSISENGITWTFDKPYEVGQFANGDWWVKGPVTIVSISPDYKDTSTGWMNGWQIDPVPGLNANQGFEERIGRFSNSLVPSLPRTINPSTGNNGIVSAVKVISRDPKEDAQPDKDGCGQTGSDRSCIETASVLTIVADYPPGLGKDVFRPAYAKTEKKYYYVSDINLNFLPSLSDANIPGKKSLQWVKDHFDVVQLDHIEVISDQYLYPKGLNSYSAGRATSVAEAALALMLDDPAQDKLPSLIAYMQGGIDLYGIFTSGDIPWTVQGGHANGRKLPIVFTAVLLNNQPMKDTMMNVQPIGNQHLYFNEDGETYFSPVADNGHGKVLWGTNLVPQGGNIANWEDKYWDRIKYDQGNRLIRDPYGLIDGGDTVASGYQFCCTSMPWKYTALAAMLIPEIQQVWNWEPFFDYTDRWVEFGAWSKPDPCAPASQGGGPNLSRPGECILDPDLTPGSTFTNFSCQAGKECGRFPAAHNQSANSGGNTSAFGNQMWDRYRAQIVE